MVESPRFNYVGKSKANQGLDSSHSWGGGVLPRDRTAWPPKAPAKNVSQSTAEQLYFQLKEFEEFRSPSFNVLYVQTPRSTFSKAPFIAELGQVIQETVELLAPLTRWGIPRATLKDKLPYYREDRSPLPNTVRPRVQKVLRANIQYAQNLATASQEAAEEWAELKKQRKDARKAVTGRPQVLSQQLDNLRRTWESGASQHHLPHIPQPQFYTSEMPAWVVPMLNVAAYWYLCGLGALDIWKQ